VSFAEKHVRSKTQIFVLLWSKVNEQITVRLICFHGKCELGGTHLLRQTAKLADVAWIFEQDHIVGVEAYGSDVFVFMEQILYEE